MSGEAVKGGREEEIKHPHSYGLPNLPSYWPREPRGGTACNVTPLQANGNTAIVITQRLRCVGLYADCPCEEEDDDIGVFSLMLLRQSEQCKCYVTIQIYSFT